MFKRIFILFIIVTTILLIYFFHIPKNNSVFIKLHGKKIVTINLGEKYKEDGFKAVDNGKNVNNKVKIQSNINYKKSGVYQINYTYSNKNVKVKERRYIKIRNLPYYKTSYDKIDNTTRGWWSGNKKDHTRPSGGADINVLKKYNAYFLGSNEKVIYLTFDEGSNDTYVKEIVTILNNNDVKGTFFLCKKYMETNKDLIKQMVFSGHSIGNHTANHYSMPSLATKEKFAEFLNEIESVEKTYENITGKQMDKVYRDPRGEWSYRGLQIMKDLGYKSYFYSADYLDWDGNVSKEYALNELMKRYHNGAIYLLHPKNKGNYLALDDFIKEMKRLGYKFELVKNIL